MATKAQLIIDAATMLGILGEGETLPSYENGDLTRAYAQVFAALEVKSMTTWDSDEDIPDEYAPYIVTLMAASRADHYPTPNDRYVRIMNAAARAPGEIRELISSNVYDTPQPDYF